MEEKNNLLWYQTPAQEWSHALPLGNGRIGAMVYGGTKTERFSLNEDTLWSGYPKKRPDVSKKAIYETIQKLTKERRYEEAQALFEQEMSYELCQVYLPLGDIVIDFDGVSTIQDYTRSLNLQTAVSKTAFCSDGISFTREAFVSAPHQVMAVKLESSAPASFLVRFESQLRTKVTAEKNELCAEGICPSYVPVPGKHYNADNIHYYEEDEKKGVCFFCILHAETDGALKERDGMLMVENAQHTTLYFAVRTSYNGWNKSPYLNGKEYKEACRRDISEALDTGYDEIKAKHIADYSALFQRLDFSLSGYHAKDLPTDERLSKFQQEHTDVGLYEMLFQFGRYLTVASSREGTQATNLQGIWNHKLTPPWNCNYTTNINTEMNYWPTLAANLAECNLPLVKFVQELREAGTNTAKVYYDAPGFVCHHNSDLWRYTEPSGNQVEGSTRYGLWPFAGAWLARHLFEHYEYTDDVEFLKNTAYPVLKDAALFLEALLTENEAGELVVCPSTSPENGYFYNEKIITAAKNATMATSIVRDLFEICIKACGILQMDDAFCNRLTKNLEKLIPLKIGSKGQILEYDEEYEEPEQTHRHISHLYAMYPANDVTPQLAEACKQSLLRRGDQGTGWSLAWKLNQWARLNDGDHCLKLLTMQLNLLTKEQDDGSERGGTYINFLCAHPPFQIDGNFGVTAGILEMLVQSTQGHIYLLPALPSSWKGGHIRGVVARGGITLDIVWQNGVLTDLTVCSRNLKNVTLHYQGKEQAITLHANEKKAVAF